MAIIRSIEGFGGEQVPTLRPVCGRVWKLAWVMRHGNALVPSLCSNRADNMLSPGSGSLSGHGWLFAMAGFVHLLGVCWIDANRSASKEWLNHRSKISRVNGVSPRFFYFVISMRSPCLRKITWKIFHKNQSEIDRWFSQIHHSKALCSRFLLA